MLRLGSGNPKQEYTLGELTESSPAEKGLGAAEDKKLDMSQHCALEAKEVSYILGFIKNIVASRSREVILSFYYDFVRPLLEYCIQLQRLQHKKDMELSEQIQKRTTNMIRGLERLCYEDTLRELGFSMEERFQGDPFII
ncbi:hypothetical protein WISP_136807 [Willisornis vidua]|uniref:Uncharacterized protein n=1 Tax=Willisornis vidua TaxID=1566151 RepID=A0ABQ9CU80_9PASS|nr:hypothetical protein WISP_136807 [Willisornis vidua]